jgi:hypothetical protein
MQVSSSSITQAYAGYSARAASSASGGTALRQCHVHTGSGGNAASTDSAQISSQGFAALLQSSSDASSAHTPTFTADQAQQIGALIQQQDSAAFTKLDGDQDGTLSVDELTTALQSLADQQPPPPPSGGKPPEMTDDLAAKIGTMMQQHDPDQFTALDSDQNGTLSAAEMQAGRESGTLKPPPPPPGMDGSGGGPSPDRTGGGGATGSSSTSDLTANLIQDLLRSLQGTQAA